MNQSNHRKLRGACFGLSLVLPLICARTALAEVPLIDKDGWTFYADGRVNAFASLGFGDDFPAPTPNPDDPNQKPDVIGSAGAPTGANTAGWQSSNQADANRKYFSMRVRSGFFGNVLGFGLRRKLNESTTALGYIGIWSTIETFGRDKWAPVYADAREAYLNVTGNWGSVTAGRTFGFFGRTGTEIDTLYGHGYGVGLPCSDGVGPACGHIGTGVIFPGYAAGVQYSTASLGGLRLHAGIFDPVRIFNNWDGAPYPRAEGAVTFDAKLGNTGLLKIGGEGLFQPLTRVNTTSVTDPVTGAMTDVKTDQSTSLWGVSGGARLEVGPLRVGAAAFRGQGLGLYYALAGSYLSQDEATHELRSFSGFYGQLAGVFGKAHVALGAGVSAVDQLQSDRANPGLSLIKQQTGVSAAVYYHVSDSIVIGADYFRFMATWYGAPKTVQDPNTMTSVLTAEVLPAEAQNLNFVNAGVTYHW